MPRASQCLLMIILGLFPSPAAVSADVKAVQSLPDPQNVFKRVARLGIIPTPQFWRKPQGRADGASTSPASAPALSIAADEPQKGRWLAKLLTLLFGLAAASVCLAKANYSTLEKFAHAGLTPKIASNANFALAGFVCAAAGLLLLFWGLVFYGLLTNIAIVAAGLYATTDWLLGKGLIKPRVAEFFRPIGIPVGLACAVLTIASMLFWIIGLRLYII